VEPLQAVGLGVPQRRRRRDDEDRGAVGESRGQAGERVAKPEKERCQSKSTVDVVVKGTYFVRIQHIYIQEETWLRMKSWKSRTEATTRSGGGFRTYPLLAVTKQQPTLPEILE
jgi:hypothetical protein